MRMWAFPHLTRFAIVAMLGIVAAMAFIPEQRAPLVFGIVSVIVLLAAFALRRIMASRSPAP
jgi:GABA permease